MKYLAHEKSGRSNLGAAALFFLVLMAPAGCAATKSAQVEATPESAAPPSRPIEATSLLGEPLRRMDIPAERRRLFETKLNIARRDYKSHPGYADNHIWLGRRLAYLGRHREAVEVYTQGLERFPESHRLRRHRGHRFITLRRFDRAVEDLREAVELAENLPDHIEPDGLPNDPAVPRSTIKSNIFYHLGLAHYLRGEFDEAADAYRRGLEYASINDDMFVATTYWLYLSLRRLGRDAYAEASLRTIKPDMNVIANEDYHRLLLACKRGPAALESLLENTDEPLARATVGYGVAMGRWLRGERDRARAMLRRIVDGPYWPAFGRIAAEAELARARE